jgi:hypothetical protein
MYPGLPTSLSGAYVIEQTVDEECQANLVTHLGKPYGVWLDDTTPNLDHWIELAAGKYGPLGQKVLVAVAPHDTDLRHGPAPTVIPVYEFYPHAGSPDQPPAYDAYCVQWAWPGPNDNEPPTVEQRDQWLAAVQAHHPALIFLY